MNVVLDTNVVFTGLTDITSEAGQVVALFLRRHPGLTLCATDSLMYEYRDILERLISPQRLAGVLRQLGRMLDNVQDVRLVVNYRPIARDPGDDHVANCAINAFAVLVTFNVRDFVPVVQIANLEVVTPGEFLDALRKEGIL